MQTYEILVRERSVLPNSADMTLVRTSVGIDQVHVMFDNAEWLDFPISITFGNGDTVITQSLTTSAISGSDEWVAEGTCVIPWEVIQDSTESLRVTLQGTDSGGDHIITAYGAPLKVEECGDTASGDIPSGAPTQSEWEQAYANAQVAINSLQSKLDECDAAIAEMQQYTPQAATSETLGLVQPDNETITVDENGVITANAYTLPTAASNVLGGVMVGNTLKISEIGALNVADSIINASGGVVDGYLHEGAFYEDAEHTTEITGAAGKVYIDLSTNAMYRWAGSAYVSVSSSVEIATQAEAEAGVDNTKMMTPLRVAQAIAGQGVTVESLTAEEIHAITAQSEAVSDLDASSY